VIDQIFFVSLRSSKDPLPVVAQHESNLKRLLLADFYTKRAL